MLTGEKVYSPQSPLRDPRGFLSSAHADLARSVSLGGRLARANLRATYRRSWLGYLSLFLPAVVATAVALVLSQQRVLRIPTLPIPYAAFVITGTVLWQLFVEVLNAPLQRLRSYRHVISRSVIPHEAFILAGVVEALANAVVRLAVAMPFLIWLGSGPGPGLLWLPPIIFAICSLALCVGVLAAPFGLLYDDVSRLLLLFTSLWLFLSPVLYPISTGSLLRLNPVHPLIEGARASLTDLAIPFASVATGAGAFAALWLAWLLYRLSAPHVVARLG